MSVGTGTTGHVHHILLLKDEKEFTKKKDTEDRGSDVSQIITL